MSFWYQLGLAGQLLAHVLGTATCQELPRNDTDDTHQVFMIIMSKGNLLIIQLWANRCFLPKDICQEHDPYVGSGLENTVGLSGFDPCLAWQS